MKNGRGRLKCDTCGREFVFQSEDAPGFRNMIDARCGSPDADREHSCNGCIIRVMSIEEVANEYLDCMGSALTSPEYVRDKCHQISASFMNFLGGYAGRWLGAEMIYGFQLMEFMGQQVIGNAHVAVRVDDKVYDWTYRQFDPNCPVPRVTTVEEFRAEWPLLVNMKEA